MKFRYLLILTLAAFTAVSCAEQKTADTASVVPEDELAASVGNSWKLTREEVQSYIDQLPPEQRAKFDNSMGRAEIANRFLADELMHQEALDLGLPETPWVQSQLKDAERRILMQAYFQDQIASDAKPTEEEIYEYYNNHQDVYSTLETSRAQHIFSKRKEKLDDLKKRVVDGGEAFTTLAHKFSEDEITRADGGDLGFFNPGGFIRSVGFSDEFHDILAGLPVGGVHGPFQWEKGWSLIRINERRPAELKPFDEVRDEIVNTLTNMRLEEVRDAKIAALKEKHEWRNVMEEIAFAVNRSPEELFNLAQTIEDPHQRITVFQKVVDDYPEDKYAPQAMFMIGFVYSEELKDRVNAQREFARVLDSYPESEIANTARWMLENMGMPIPDFDDLKDLDEKIKG